MKYTKNTTITTILFMTLLCFANPLIADLVTLYTFDGDTKDIVSAYDGTTVGDVTFTNGKFGQSIYLDGDGDYLNISIPEMLPIATISLWLKYRQFESELSSVITHTVWDDFGCTHLNLFSEGKVEFTINRSKETEISTTKETEEIALSSSETLSPGTWHHIAVTYDNSNRTIKMYLDGKLDNQRKAQEYILVFIGEARIGTWEPEGDYRYRRFFKGNIDDVAVFDYALNQDEILQIYKAGASSLLKPGTSKINNALRQGRILIKKQKYQEAIACLEKAIDENKKQQADEEIQFVNLYRQMFFLLAQARKASGVSNKDVITAYKKSLLNVYDLKSFTETIIWLYRNLSPDDFSTTLKKCLMNSNLQPEIVSFISYLFQTHGNWNAFTAFVDAVLAISDKPVDYAIAIHKELEQGPWSDKFFNYCRKREHLKKYALKIGQLTAEQNFRDNKFSQAAKIYDYLANQLHEQREKGLFKFKQYECIFNNGEYQNALQKLDYFIKYYKTTNRKQIISALLLKGRAYIQLGKTEDALDVFLQLLIDYPYSIHASQSCYFIGYLYMLQGNFKQAQKAFNLILMDYPESKYAPKAKISLIRIENMTE